MHRLVHEYYNAQSDAVVKRGEIASEIAEAVGRCGLRIDGGMPGTEAAFVAAVHDELMALEGDFAPAGQHVFGRDLSVDDRREMFLACLEFADVDLNRLLADCFGIDYDALAREPHVQGPSGEYNHETLEQIRDAARSIIESEVFRSSATGAREAVLGILRSYRIADHRLLRDPYAEPEIQPFIARTRRLWEELGHVGDAERSGLLAVLDGRYIDPSPGGEIVGDWDVLPTGRNMASTDVRMLPRETAQRKGVGTVEQLLVSALAQRGAYPQAALVQFMVERWSTKTPQSFQEAFGRLVPRLRGRFSAEIIARFSMLRVFLSSPGRPQA